MGIEQPIWGWLAILILIEQKATPAAATDIYYVAGFSTKKVKMTDKAEIRRNTSEITSEGATNVAALAYDSVCRSI